MKHAPLAKALSEAARRRVPLWIYARAPWNEEARAWEREVYDAPVTRELRAHFVSFEFDAAEMPELDHAVQFALTHLAGRSGWPAHLFLDPAGRPLMGATSLTAPALEDLLGQLLRAWTVDAESLSARAEGTRQALRAADPLAASPVTEMDPAERDDWLSDQALSAWLTPFDQSLDFETGWVGRGDLYLYPSVYKCLLAREDSMRWGLMALTNLSRTQMFDVMQGGYFRAAGRDPTQPVSTEKLLAENAEMLEALTECVGLPNSDFAASVATDTLRVIVEDFAASANGSFAAALSGHAPYYRVTPSDLIAMCTGPERQPVQMFFGIEAGNQVPFLQTELPLLATYLKLPPVDLSHMLQSARRKVLANRQTRPESQRPQAMGASVAAEATALRAIYLASRKLPAALPPERAEEIGAPILARWNDLKPSALSPRAEWSIVLTRLSAARSALQSRNRDLFLRRVSEADETLQARLDPNDVALDTAFAGERLDMADHLGASAAGLRLHALRERLEIARVEGDARTLKRLLDVELDLMARALRTVKPLGLHASSVWNARLRSGF